MRIGERMVKKGFDVNGLPRPSFEKLLRSSSDEILKEDLKGNYDEISIDEKK